MGKTWVKVLVALMVFFSIGALCISAFIRKLEKKAFVDQHYLSGKYLHTFLQDEQIVRTIDLYKSTTTRLDAGPYLNDRLTWDGDQNSTQNDNFGVTQELVNQFSEWKEQWPEKILKLSFEKIDLSIFKQIENTDHWAIEKSSFIQNAMAQGKTTLVLPLPSFGRLIVLAKILLISAKNHEQALKALKDVRHLSQLIFTTETLIGNMVSISLLRTEAQALAYWKKFYSMNIAWTVPTEDALAIAKRYFWAWPTYTMFTLPKDQWDTVYSSRTHRPGICAAINESSYLNALGELMLKEYYLKGFEQNQSIFSRYQNDCRLGLRTTDRKALVRSLSNQGSKSYLMDTSNVLFSVIQIENLLTETQNPLKKVIKKAIGLILVSIGAPHYMRHYENLQNPTSRDSTSK